MEQKVDLDSRPFFPKSPGEIGIYIDFKGVEPIDRHQYGSLQYMRMDFLEKLYEQLSKIELYKIKGVLEKNGLMDGVIIEKWHKGVVLSISFDSQGALNEAWRQYDQQKVGPVIVSYLNTPELLKAIGATKLEMRAQIWHDEVEACRMEMDNIRVKSFSLKDKEYDQEMMREMKHFKQATLFNLTEELKEQYASMDKTFPQMTIIIKKNIPIKVSKITSFQEFQRHHKAILASKRAETKPFDDYINIRKKIRDTINIVESNICHRLAEVHAQCETEHQHELKYKLKTECAHARERLADDYDWSHLKHPEWEKKILRREHPFFLGMASVIAAGMDTLLEIDLQCDDYLSGVDVDKVKI